MKDILFTGLFILGVMLIMASCQTTIKTHQTQINWGQLSKQLELTVVKTNNLKSIEVKRVNF